MIINKVITIFVLSILYSNTAISQVFTVDEPHPSPGSWYCFRNCYLIDGKPKNYILRIAADTKYWLWINGKLEISEGGLKRGPNPKDTYCDIIKNISHLKKGRNYFSILVWYFGKDGFSHRNTPTPGICIELKNDSKVTLPCGKWKYIKHPAFYVPESEKPNFRLAESNIGYDANKKIDIVAPNLDDNNWNLAKEISLKDAGWNTLVDRPIPFWKDYGLKGYEKTERNGDTLKAYLPYNAQITPYLRLYCKAGETVKIQTDDYRGGSAPNVFAEYKTAKGDQEFECKGWMNGHEVLYILPKDAKIIDVKYRETGFNSDFAGSFSCDDNFLNRLWNKAQRTLYITMRDTYMDCPDRERAQWWGDVVNELGESFYALDENAHSLTRKGIRELMDWQRPDSTIYAPVPSGNYESELPMQMLASVGYYGFWTYYLGTSDSNTIKYVYPKVKKYIHVWKTDAQGFVIPRKGGWTWGDWGENKDMTLLYNEWYLIALQGYEKMSTLVGNINEASWAQSTQEKLRRVFHQKFWKGSYYISPDFKGEPDDRAQALAVVSGILPDSLFHIIRPIFNVQYHSSPYMEKYVLQALCKMGYYDDALARMKYRYSEMVNSPLSTLWEGWGLGEKGFGGGTYNHAWSGGPLTILSQFILGAEPAEPGFSIVRLSPHLSYLKHIYATLPLNKNRKMNITIHKTEDTCDISVKVPKGIKLDFILPSDYQRMMVNGKTTANNSMLLESGKWKIKLLK
jgi:alpha-L-rhamnosidase